MNNPRYLIAFFLFIGLALPACGGAGALKDKKYTPDEFAVLTKTPLMVPPAYDLKPPSQLSKQTSQPLPLDKGDLSGLSPTEISLLQKAQAQNIGNEIREELQYVDGGVVQKEEGFLEKIIDEETQIDEKQDKKHDKKQGKKQDKRQDKKQGKKQDKKQGKKQNKKHDKKQDKKNIKSFLPQRF